MDINFCDNWYFQKEGNVEERCLSLPHDAMLSEERDPDCHNGENTGYFPGGVYRYRKTFDCPTENPDEEVSLFFEAVYQNCKVYVNGALARSHKYGFTEFEIPITDFLLKGKNEVLVIADNHLEPNCRWYSGSGIFRPVWLRVRKKEAPRWVHVVTKSLNPVVMEITCDRTDADIAVTDSEGKTILSGKPGVYEAPDASLWDIDHPVLYRVSAKNAFGEVSSAFGIRTIRWNTKEGFLVNGKRVLLRGGCIHHDNGILGACDFREASFRKVATLKKAGYNAIRAAHNPLSRTMLEACDTLGMYVMDECFDGWYTPKNYHDYARYFNECWKDDLTAMVEKDYNHPSVIIYSVGNEVSETASEKGGEVCGMLRDHVHSLDVTRPVTAGINVLLNVYTNMGLGVYKDTKEYKPEPLPPKKSGYKDKKTGSTFFNVMAQKLGKLMFHMSAGKKGDRALSYARPALDIVGLNYASSRFKEDLSKYPDCMMAATETMVTDLPYNWPYIEKCPAIIGDFVWAAWDYLGEAAVGDYMYYSYPGLPLLAGSGTIDSTGYITAEAYLEQVIWGLRKKPYICVAPLNHTYRVPKKSAWRFTNAVESWTWQGYEGMDAEVEVYSVGKYIRLYKNGEEVGRGELIDYRTKFKTPYYPGVLEAVSYDENDREIDRFSLATGGEETFLQAVSEEKFLKPSPQDIAYIDISFCDREGEVKPYLERPVEVRVRGDAVLAGFGSAVTKTDQTYQSGIFNTYRGRALLAVRGTGREGRAAIEIKSPGYETKELILPVRKGETSE